MVPMGDFHRPTRPSNIAASGGSVFCRDDQRFWENFKVFFRGDDIFLPSSILPFCSSKASDCLICCATTQPATELASSVHPRPIARAVQRHLLGEQANYTVESPARAA